MAQATLTFFGGVDEIGGNKFLLDTGRTRVFLDFGMSFGREKDYFSEFLQPRALNGVGDYWALNILPRIPGIYRNDYLSHQGLPKEERGLDGVIVTHAHMDHIGDIHFLREDVPIVASDASFGIMKALEEVGSGDEYLNFKPAFRVGLGKSGKTIRQKDVATIPRPTLTFGVNEQAIGDVKVRGTPEDHSLPGAHGIFVDAATTRITYTGDFRFHGRHGGKSMAFVDAARAFEPDYLLIEGTRVTDDAGTSEGEVAAEIAGTIRSTPKLVIANWPVRDTDRLLSFYDAAKSAGRKLCVSSKQAFVLQELRAAGETELPSLDDPHLRIYIRRKGWGLWGRAGIPQELALQDYDTLERTFATHRNAIMAEGVRDRPEDYVVRLDFFELAELIDLQPPPGSVYIRSVTEPFDEEMKIDKERTENWLKHFGLFPYVQRHASGHASGPELWNAIKAIEPRTVVPIHTERHDLFVKNLEPLGIKVARPQNALLGGKPMEL
ncbi:MAG: MBL fold metallo-hydrolase [Euryarchaeota archaeon]|nr:MBL fold metallo-hydrolase [Euryarchaeota archaeon]